MRGLIQRIASPGSRPERRAAAVFFLLAAIFLALAITLPKPWDEGLARRLEARAEKGLAPRPQDHAARLLFWIALASAGVCAALGGAARFWARGIPAERFSDPDSPEPSGSPDPSLIARRRRETAAFWGALLLLSGLAFLVRWPLATKSLWWDEAWTVRHVVVGERVPDAERPGSFKFVKRDWARTAWYYAKPTNHAGFSVLSRLSNDAWRSAAGAEPWAFSEWAVRMPSLAASAGAVILIGLLGRALLGGWGGLLAALALAIHPWFIRYGVDARAFGLNVFFSLAASVGFFHALRSRGAWPPIMLHGLASFALLFTFPYNVYLPAAFFLTLGVAALMRRLPREIVFRFAAANAVAAMIFILVAAPWIPQAMAWTDVQGEDMAGPRLNAIGLAQTWSSFLTGTPLKVEGAGTVDAEGLPSIQEIAAGQPWVWPWFWIALPLLLLAGVASSLLRRGAEEPAPFAWLQIAWLFSLALPLAVAFWKQHYYYERYIIYALPGVLLSLVAGIFAVSSFLARPFPRAARRLVPLLGVLLVAPLFAIQMPQRRVLMERPYSPARDVAAFLSKLPAGPGGEPILLGYGLGGNVPAIYEPRIRFTYVPGGLLDAMAESRASGRPLYVFYGYSQFSRNNPEGGAREAFRYLDDPAIFTEEAAFKGIEPAFYHRILKYTGKAVDAGDGRR